MTLTPKTILISVATLAAACALAFLAGRSSVEPVVKVETRTATVDKWRTKTVYKTKTLHKVTTKKPDGTVVIIEDSKTHGTATETATENTKADTKVTASTYRPSWRVSALGGLNIPQRSWVYGGSVEHRVAGPVWLGAWATSNGVVGIKASLEF